MEYRRLGKTGLMISVVALGGHWKRLGPVLGRAFTGSGYDREDFDNILCPDFRQNRDEIVSRALDLGINYVDACAPAEVLAYAQALRGRRDKVCLGYSWHTREPRYPEWRSARALVAGLEAGLREAELDFADIWRISLPADGIEDLSERQRIEEATIEGLGLAKKQGKARFTGVSSHDRAWLRRMAAQYPQQIEVVLFPFTAGSSLCREASLLDTLQANDTGALAIKPFAGGGLFQTPGDWDLRARLAVRYILAHSAITATVAGYASAAQLENAAASGLAPLDSAEQALLDRETAGMWAEIPWLRAWQQV
jgi:aryl-alcohol dehydrogenase-like predicted oxidoreductase